MELSLPISDWDYIKVSFSIGKHIFLTMTIFFSRKSEQQRICLPSLLLLLSSQEGRESERSPLGGICTSVSTARTLDKNEWVFTPRYISLANCATGKLWLNCDPSFCGSEWIKTALGKRQSMVQYPSSLSFWICLSDGNFHLNLCRSITAEKNRIEQAPAKIEIMLLNITLQQQYWLLHFARGSKQAASFLPGGSLRHSCLRCLPTWSLAVKEGTAVLIAALCAGRICCCSVSENSCEKHKLIPGNLGARTT